MTKEYWCDGCGIKVDEQLPDDWLRIKMKKDGHEVVKHYCAECKDDVKAVIPGIKKDIKYEELFKSRNVEETEKTSEKDKEAKSDHQLASKEVYRPTAEEYEEMAKAQSSYDEVKEDIEEENISDIGMKVLESLEDTYPKGAYRGEIAGDTGLSRVEIRTALQYLAFKGKIKVVPDRHGVKIEAVKESESDRKQYIEDLRSTAEKIGILTDELDERITKLKEWD